jgi:putative ABC transport system permease protein
VIVGFVIVALSMFSAVVDNIREFGTLKAMGATTFDLAKLLFVQAVAYATIGCTLGLFLVTRMAEGIRSANLVLVLPWWMFAGTFVFMVLLCVVASSLALVRVRSVEPGMVFR